MARAIWKGQLVIEAFACEVTLHAAASQAERVTFHLLNRATGNRLRREYFDPGTGEPVEREDQVKGYRTEGNSYVLIEPEDLEAALPDSDGVLRGEGFIACGEVDPLYLDRPYFLAPARERDAEAYALLLAGLRARESAALARAVLFRRVRALLIRPAGRGLVAHTLRFDYEVKPPDEAFADIPEIRVGTEMLELAEHIIRSRSGDFHPSDFDDRYDAALAELVWAKSEGRAIKAPRRPPAPKVVDLMEALRASTAGKGGAKGKGAPARKTARRAGSGAGSGAGPRRKAG